MAQARFILIGGFFGTGKTTALLLGSARDLRGRLAAAGPPHGRPAGLRTTASSGSFGRRRTGGP